MKKIHTFGAVCALLGLLLGGALPAAAQELRIQSRAKVWDVYFNTGTQGVRQATEMTFFRPVGMAYPGVFWVQYPKEFINYWGVRDWGSTQFVVWYSELAGTMPGFNTFVGTVVDGAYHVSESKANLESEDVVQMVYDPSKGPEANIGQANPSPLGPIMSNWWPGQKPPGPNEAVEIHNYTWGKYMDPDKDTFPESTIIAKWTTKRGITVTKKAYAWSYPDYDDFEILEYTFENTGDSNGDGKADLGGGAGLQLNDTFFIFSTRFYVSQNGQANYSGDSFYRSTQRIALDDWYKYTEAGNFDGPAAAKGLKMWYAFDADNPDIPGNDIGKPYSKDRAESSWHDCCLKATKKEGELGAYQYVGVAPLAYTPGGANDPKTFTYDTKGDARFVAPRVASQPHTVKWWNYRDRTDYDEPGSEKMSSEKIYKEMTSPAPLIQNQPAVPGGVNGTFAYGPYDLAPGDKVRIVYALVAAAPVEENIWGWAKLGIQADMRTDKAVNNLLKHHKAARDAFMWGYDLPDPPPDVKAQMGASVEGYNKVTWGDAGDGAADPDYTGAEARDVKGYRVYRSDFKPDDWQLFADIPVKDPKYYKGGSYEFEDLKSLTGFQYVYRVAAYDTGHPNWNNTGTSVRSLEGGNSSPEQWANGVLANSPFFPANAAADQMQRKISIVPNPYKVDGSHAYPQLGLMRFTNLPRKAKIRIFTVAGEFVADFEHNDPSKAEAGWTQVPLFRGGTASAGLYYWVVESLVPESQGRTQSGTLMIIK